ncbi:peptidylprolyl isomerase [Longispora sp. K20-0274]|uniref:peptidylprolyl isomerase n=1 Tax=Longispora sp. K20-0274 TaxID=3088255 RepID=UPI00399C2FCE
MTMPPPPPRRSLSTLMVVLIVACTLLICAGVTAGGVAAWITLRPVRTGAAVPPPSPGSAAAGDCVWNPGDAGESTLRPTTPKTVERRKMTATIVTNLGTITIELYGDKAPCSVAALRSLADQHFYDNVACHRVTTPADGLVVLQCGDPSGKGTGGPGYQYAEENLPVGQANPYPRGTLALARTATPGTNGSQFFIVGADAQLSADYSVVGTVTRGMDIVDQVVAGGHSATSEKPNVTVTMTKVTVS